MKKILILIVCVCALSAFTSEIENCYPVGDVDAGSYKAFHRIVTKDAAGFEYVVAGSGTVNGKATVKYYAELFADVFIIIVTIVLTVFRILF